MKTNFHTSLGRRRFLTLSASAMVLPLFSRWIPREKTPSARYLLTAKGRKVGIKISEHSDGQLYMSLREIGARKLAIIPLSRSKATSGQREASKAFRLKNKQLVSLKMGSKGTITSNIKDLKIKRVDYLPGDDSSTSEGFFDWLSGAVNDVLAGIGTAITWLIGGEAFFTLSGGGEIWVQPGKITYLSGFKREPNLEEEPNIWY